MEELEAVLETGGAAAAELAASALSWRGRKCANCQTPLTGRYCANCGQSADMHRRSVVHLTQELVNDIASFDSRILRTAKALLFRPGELAQAFRQGRTQSYVPPVRLYLFVSLIFFLALSFTNVAIFQFVMTATPERVFVENGHVYMTQPDGGKVEMPAHYADGKQHYNISSNIIFFARQGTLHADLPPGARARMMEDLNHATAKAEKNNKAGPIVRTVTATMIKLANDPAALNGALTAWIPRALFLLLPIFALLLAACYWRQRSTLYFVDHLVFSLGLHSFAFALLLGAAALAQIFPGEAVLWLAVAVLGLYLLLAMKRFYGQSWLWTGLKFAAVSVLYIFVFVLPAFGGVIAAAAYWG